MHLSSKSAQNKEWEEWTKLRKSELQSAAQLKFSIIPSAGSTMKWVGTEVVEVVVPPKDIILQILTTTEKIQRMPPWKDGKA